MIHTIDLIIRVKNGYLAEKQDVVARYSRMNEDVMAILKKAKYIKDYEVVEDGAKKSIKIDLLYTNRVPALRGVKILSRPGQRRYAKCTMIRPVQGGLGIALVSTPQGVMTDKDARKVRSGGEVLFNVW